jgi:fluoroacetyl-CoA thioesterase
VEEDGTMKLELVGAEATVEWQVTPAMTARTVGSGEVDVLGSPWVLAVVERAAVDAVAPLLPEGAITVGASFELTHSAPTVVGKRIRAHARAESVDGRKIRFSFVVSDEAGEVARGSQVRVVVDRKRFERHASSRAAPNES